MLKFWACFLFFFRKVQCTNFINNRKKSLVFRKESPSLIPNHFLISSEKFTLLYFICISCQLEHVFNFSMWCLIMKSDRRTRVTIIYLNQKLRWCVMFTEITEKLYKRLIIHWLLFRKIWSLQSFNPFNIFFSRAYQGRRFRFSLRGQRKTVKKISPSYFLLGFGPLFFSVLLNFIKQKLKLPEQNLNKVEKEPVSYFKFLIY